jgi:hypothetical protein
VRKQVPEKKKPGLFRAGRPPKFEGKRIKRPYVENHRQPHAGRPRKQIDWAAVRRMAMKQCTPEEIALFVGVSEPTLRSYENFLPIYKQGYLAGNVALRRAQYELAMQGNVAMLKFLGKHRLGQRTSGEHRPTDQHFGGPHRDGDRSLS